MSDALRIQIQYQKGYDKCLEDVQSFVLEQLGPDERTKIEIISKGIDNCQAGSSPSFEVKVIGSGEILYSHRGGSGEADDSESTTGSILLLTTEEKEDILDLITDALAELEW
eukprot:CAMPEP_0194204130 /NCGR_PEP_ID=MMETSP0156-20130528/3745_1 /TAXON_ID=33649 /ORGANISM="Thalassionema nitzschioides, Strain L26-B" /LENGTH=111 /DNA_ID=CAMNT_0038930071 /DNA_START=126 /DNA_END=458 /DNA_ORIENTATION=+